MFLKRLFRITTSVMEVCGINQNFQLGEKSNKTSIGDIPIISPYLKSRIDPSTILSYSIYSGHAVYITKDGKMYAIGDNTEGQISGSLPKEVLKEYTAFEIKDSKDVTWIPISVVCGYSYTMYLVSNPDNSSQKRLAYSYKDTEDPYPVFLNIKRHIPISLYGGNCNAAAIDTNGSIIFVPESTSNYSTSVIEARELPDNEKAINVACCDTFLIVLSSKGSLYRFSTSGTSDLTTHEEVTPSKSSKIVAISGTKNHCFALDDEGRVFALGSNSSGKLGAGEDAKHMEEFQLVDTFKGCAVKDVFAGNSHSLFLTNDGKVLACGANNYGQIPVASILGGDGFNYLPIETSVSSGASFCIAGGFVSAIFLNGRPPNMANVNAEFAEQEKGSGKDEVEALKEEIERLKGENERLKGEKVKGSAVAFNIDQVVKVEMLGKGEKSESFEAELKKVCLKSFVLEDDQNALKKFDEELRKLTQIDNRNVVRIFGYSVNGHQQASIVCELCKSCLKDARGELTAARKVTTVFEVALAMKAMHALGLVHGGLRASNVMYDAEQHAKLDSFSAARLVCGGCSDQKDDVLAFGRLVVFILTGKEEEVPQEVPQEVNEFGRELIKKCCEDEKEKRPSFNEIVDMIVDEDFKIVDGVENEIQNIRSFLEL